MIYNYFFILLITNLLIFSFYYHFKTNWPEEYFGKDDKLALAISVSFVRLMLFRILPVCIICFLVFSYTDLKIDNNWWLILGISTTFIYGLLTSGVSILKIFLNSPSVDIFMNRPNQIVYHVTSIIYLVIIGIIVGFIMMINPFQYLNTGVRSLVDNTTAALLYTLIVIPGYKIYRKYVDNSSTNIDSIIVNSIRQIRENQNLYEQIINISRTYNAKSDLVLAFCVVENIQRPKWFRVIENLLPFRSTKGIMQVQVPNKISDNESIDLAVKKYLRDTKDLQIDASYLHEIVNKYNGKNSTKYILLIERALYNINYGWYQEIVKVSS